MLDNDKGIMDVVIVGSGPAGLTAAIYSARAGLSLLVLEGVQPGGQLTMTTEVDNFPGFQDGILGTELMDRMRKQAERFGTKFKYGTVVDCMLSGSPFSLELDGGEEVKSRSLIIATGASSKFLGLESEKKYLGYGVSTCAVCDGFFFRGKEVVVVGGGDTAMEESLYLTKFASKVTVVHRRDEFRASKIMVKNVRANPKIGFIFDSEVSEILGDGKNVTGVQVRNVKSGREGRIGCEGVFIAIGHSPNVHPFSKYLKVDENGYIVTKKSSMETSVSGIFACGDAQDSSYRQAVTAAGTGCMAALDVERFLQH